MFDEELDFEQQDPLAVSRLDVISCALGAAVILFLCFAAVRSRPPVELWADASIELSARIEAEPGSRPTLTFLAQPPGEQRFLPVWPRLFNASTGELAGEQLDNPISLALLKGIEPEGRLLLTGGLIDLALPATIAAVDAGPATTARTYLADLLILKPKSGEWKFRLKIPDTADVERLAGGAQRSYRVTLYWRTTETRGMQTIELPALAPAESVDVLTVTIPPQP